MDVFGADDVLLALAAVGSADKVPLAACAGAGVVDVDVGCLLDDSGVRFGSSEDGVDIQEPILRVYSLSLGWKKRMI